MVKMSIPLIIVSMYIVLLFAISFYARHRASKNSAGFLLAGRELNTAMVAVNIAGVAVGAASTIGVAENAFQVGMAAGWYTAAWAAGAVAMGMIGAKRYREVEVTTLPQFFEHYYDAKGRTASVFGLIIIQLVITSLQYLAGGAILSALLPDIFSMESGMYTSAVVFIGVTLIGGLWSSGLANIVSITLIYFGIIISTFEVVSREGGLTQLAANLPPSTDWFGPVGGLGLATITGWFVVMITQSLSAQGPVQVACAAKTATTAKRGFLWGAVLVFPIGFLCALLGLSAKVSYPSIQATMALPHIIMSLHPVLSGITLAALWAVDVSTACHLLLGAGALFSQDIYKRFLHPGISEKNYLLVNRLSVLILGLLTLYFAFHAVGILKTLLVGLSLTTAFTLVFLCTLFLPSLCRKSSAFYTTIAGIAVLIVWQFIPAARVFSHPIYLEWLVCLLTFALTALLDKRHITDYNEPDVPLIGAMVKS